jgi:hypothetical protein
VFQRLADITLEDNNWIAYLRERESIEERNLRDLQKISIGDPFVSELLSKEKELRSQFSGKLTAIRSDYLTALQENDTWKEINAAFSQKKNKFESNLTKCTKDYADKLQKRQKLLEKSSSGNGIID